MEKINYKDFLEKFNKGEIKDVSPYIKTDINLDLELMAVSNGIDSLNNLDEVINGSIPVTEYYMRKSVIYFEMIRNYTNLQLAIEDDSIDFYNIALEEEFKKNKLIQRYYDGIQSIYQLKQLDIIQQFTQALNNIPSSEEITGMTKDFEKIFGDENKDNLKLLNNIVAFNDPSMKLVKDAIYDTVQTTSQGEKGII